jgi:DNA-binding Xre family transcriptional regulator
MSAKDLQNFRYLLGQLVRAERWPRRQLEHRLGLGHKNLEKLLDGTMQTRLRHILAVAEWLGVRPGELVDLGCPETAAAARRKVADVLAPSREAVEAGVAQKGAPEAGGDLEAMIAKVVRQVLEQRKAGQGPEPPGGEPE